MKSILSKLFFPLLLTGILILNLGCPEPSSTSTIAPSICLSDLISITGNATKGGNPNNWVVTVNITATCIGPPAVPLAGTQLRLSYLGSNHVVTTDAAGMYTRRFGPATGNPSGNRFTVTAKGSDGVEVPLVTITVP